MMKTESDNSPEFHRTEDATRVNVPSIQSRTTYDKKNILISSEELWSVSTSCRSSNDDELLGSIPSVDISRRSVKPSIKVTDAMLPGAANVKIRVIIGFVWMDFGPAK